MPFKEVTVNDLRREFVVFAQQDGINFSALCRRYGISRTHGYDLVERAREQGLAGMEVQSRRPTLSPRQTPPEMEAQIVALRQEHPDWGARKLRARLLALGLAPPAKSTITSVLHRHGLIHPPPDGPTGAGHRFEHHAPNDLWQMDFLGHKRMQ